MGIHSSIGRAPYAYAKAMGSNPLKSWIFFFRINLHLLKIRWQVSLFKSKSNGYKIELTFKVDERCQTRPWVEKSGRPTPFFHRVLFHSVTHERCQTRVMGWKICTKRRPTPFFYRVLFYSVTHLYGVAHRKVEVHRVFSRQKHLVHKRFSTRVLKTNLWKESKQGSRVHVLFYQ